MKKIILTILNKLFASRMAWFDGSKYPPPLLTEVLICYKLEKFKFIKFTEIGFYWRGNFYLREDDQNPIKYQSLYWTDLPRSPNKVY